MDSVSDILKALETRLRYRKRVGGDRLPVDLAKRLDSWIAAMDRSVPEGDADARLDRLAGQMRGCARCELHLYRRNVVVGEGSPSARIVFVGEGPGEEEDAQGRPFVGPAGRLLNRIIQAMELHREDVYIANVVKCRPPRNRAPRPEEISSCSSFLYDQLKAIAPEVICTLGAVAAHTLLESTERISRLRGRFHRWQGVAVMPTYHPSYLLRNPEKKRDVWEDMKKIMALLRLDST